jgi:hypothetical protein
MDLEITLVSIRSTGISLVGLLPVDYMYMYSEYVSIFGLMKQVKKKHLRNCEVLSYSWRVMIYYCTVISL